MHAAPPYPLIGLTGRKRTGKDSVADALSASAGYARASFADAVREAALDLDPWIPEYVDRYSPPVWRRLSDVVALYGWEEAKDRIPEVRRTLQRLGTDVVRKLDSELWVEYGLERAGLIEGPVVFTDCRFPNEADAIRAAGGIIVRVVRPGLPDDGDKHESETALDDYPVDVTIRNDSTLTALHDRARDLARDYHLHASRR